MNELIGNKIILIDIFLNLWHHRVWQRNVGKETTSNRVSVQEVKSLGGHFAWLCRGVDFYKVKKKFCCSKRKWKYFYTFNHIYSEKSSKRANSTNHPAWIPICQNKPAITPKWFNSLDTNSNLETWDCSTQLILPPADFSSISCFNKIIKLCILLEKNVKILVDSEFRIGTNRTFFL